MSELFGPEFFATNRANLKQLFGGTAPIVITANGLLQRSGDTTYPFKQDSGFWYLTGINEPGVVLVIDKEKEYLIVPEKEAQRVIFEGAIDKSALSKISGINAVLDSVAGWKQLGSRLKRVKHVATLMPLLNEAQIGFYANPSRAELLKQINNHGEFKFVDLRLALARLRSVKQPAEIKAITSAIGLSVRAFKKVKRGVGKFKNEAEITALITNEFLSNGAGHAYQPIVAAGLNACILHYNHNNSAIKKDALVLIDSGAEVNNYAADLTRVYSEHPTKRQIAVWQAVCDIQDYAYSLLKPSIVLKHYEKQIEHFAGEKLRELGLIKSITKEQVRRFYPHATSHFLGLDVHDTGDYRRPLEPDMVLTVEPGIYIPKEELGIRIEDNVLITTEGIEVLSRQLRRELW